MGGEGTYRQPRQWLCKFGADKQSPSTASSPKLMRADMQKRVNEWQDTQDRGHSAQGAGRRAGSIPEYRTL